VDGVIESVVAETTDLAVLQPFTRFATFTEPSPVARSYPTVL
jgi:hypothetical protein